MALTDKQTTTHNGFAIPLQSDTDLGLAMLIAEGEDGGHEPVAVVATIREARGVASSDLRDRMRRMDQGDDCFARKSTSCGLAVLVAATAWCARSPTSCSKTLTSTTSRRLATGRLFLFSLPSDQPQPLARAWANSRQRWPTRQPVNGGANVCQTWRHDGQPLQEPEFRRPVHQRPAQSLHVRMPCP